LNYILIEVLNAYFICKLYIWKWFLITILLLFLILFTISEKTLLYLLEITIYTLTNFYWNNKLHTTNYIWVRTYYFGGSHQIHAIEFWQQIDINSIYIWLSLQFQKYHIRHQALNLIIAQTILNWCNIEVIFLGPAGSGRGFPLSAESSI